MLPMTAGIILTIQARLGYIQRTGRYKIFTVAGVALILGRADLDDHAVTGDTSLWTVGAMFFVLGAGLGLIMQNVVLAAQNAVAPTQIGTATSHEQLLPRGRRHRSASPIFGTLFTSRLADNLAGVFARRAGRRCRPASPRRRRWCPPRCRRAGEPLRTAIIDAYANALAPVFWYLVPILAVALRARAVPRGGPAVRRGRHGRPRRGPRGRRLRHRVRDGRRRGRRRRPVRRRTPDPARQRARRRRRARHRR